MKTLVSKYNLTLITYESGQSLVETNVMEYGNGETAGLTNLFISVNQDPRMYDLYKLYIQTLMQINLIDQSRPLMHFSSCGISTKYGSWGAIEFTGQPINLTPKYRALIEILSSYNKPRNIQCESYLLSNSYINDRFLSLNSYTGYPVIISPRRMDTWLSEHSYFIQWMTDGISNNEKVDIILHKVQNCIEKTTTTTSTSSLSLSSSYDSKIYTFGFNITLKNGIFKVVIPDNSIIVFDGTPTYFIEIRGQYSSNYSEIFSIQTQYYLNNTQYTCCKGTITPIFNQCLYSQRNEYSYQLFNESRMSQTLANLDGLYCTSPYSYWPSASCTYDKYGCRYYYTSRDSNKYGLFKPVTDCVSLNSNYPKFSLNDKLWDNSKNIPEEIESSFLKCDNEMSLYPLKPNTCDISIGINDPNCLPRTKTPTSIPSSKPTYIPSSIPTKQATLSPVSPTKLPTFQPSLKPTREPTFSPSIKPSPEPSMKPTREPTFEPTFKPTREPTSSPTLRPSREPTTLPTFKPSTEPTIKPTTNPTFQPSLKPSRDPTFIPTFRPSREPTLSPTLKPSREPTFQPSLKPTREPTLRPSFKPTFEPTFKPTIKPSFLPTTRPIFQPSFRPSVKPT